jgi:two-component system, NarL family, nitrate/nitrite response regulator NarL
MLGELQPEVAVIDILLPELPGTKVLAEVKRTLPGIRVLVLSAMTDSKTVYDSVKLGADGYISKTADRREICDGITAIGRGRKFFSPEVHDAIADEIRRRDTPARPILTNREREILALVADGQSVPKIAGRIHVSDSTVKTHMLNIFDKLGKHERAAAVAEAMRRGILE